MQGRIVLRVLVALAILAACAWVVRRQLAGLALDDVLHAIDALPSMRLRLAALATAGSFASLAVLEHALFAAIAAPLPWRRVAPVAFVANAVSVSVGLVLVSGTLIRLRLYRRWQVPASDVVRVSLAFAPVVISSGLLGSGVALAAGFDDAQRALSLPAPTLAVLVVALMLPAALVVAAAGGRTWRWGRLSVVVPSRGRRLALLAAGLCDWTCLSGAALALTGLPLADWPLFLPQFIVGWLFGATSGLPAGAGAIDATMLATFGAHAGLASLAAGLLLFRLVYFILPTLAALALWAAIEWTTTTTSEQA